MKHFVIISILFIAFGFSLFSDNKPTKAEIGEKLFFDPILSLDSTISCASCHNPKFGFADTSAFSKGVGGKLGTRNTPSVMNMKYRELYFWDGRAASLEHQVSGPIENPVEMNLKFAEAVKRIQKSKDYSILFEKVYGAKPDSSSIVNAIAEFERTLESNGSAPHDLWINGDDDALTVSQKRGRKIFVNKGKCFECHFTSDFTNDEFRNIGTYNGKELNDRGRFEITKDSADLGAFKVPGLRNVALTPPYMHNGMFKTLKEVVEFYDNPYKFVENPINMDSLIIEPLNLTEQEKEDLVNYLNALTDKSFVFQFEKY